MAGSPPSLLAPLPRGASPQRACLGQHVFVVERKEGWEDFLLGQVTRGAHHHDAESRLVPVLLLQAIHLRAAGRQAGRQADGEVRGGEAAGVAGRWGCGGLVGRR